MGYKFAKRLAWLYVGIAGVSMATALLFAIGHNWAFIAWLGIMAINAVCARIWFKTAKIEKRTEKINQDAMHKLKLAQDRIYRECNQ